MNGSLLPDIPNMNSLLEHPLFEGLQRERVKRAAQEYLAGLRSGILSGEAREMPALDGCAANILAMLGASDIPHMRRLINATGIVLHTHLGRAPLGAELCAAITEACRGYSNLEYDLETGQRGDRFAHIETMLCELTGAEAAMAVNNNAAAVFLMLSALAKGKRVAISRGELVEIGGSFRIPEIMEQSGAELVEVGATNRTRLSDYRAAVDQKGAEALLKVHTSNYVITGFTESVSASELAAFGKEKGLPVLYDMGSCFMIEPELLGLGAGESARGGVASGVDVLCFSGDKLLGSVQAGILAGRGRLIAAMKKHPAARMLRPDKLTLSALEATLALYRYPEEAKRCIPALAMLSAHPQDLHRRACSLAERLSLIYRGWEVSVCETLDEAGGGALPHVRLPGWAVALRPGERSGLRLEEWEKRLRQSRLPVVIRIHDGMALLALRTILPGEEEDLLAVLRSELLQDEFNSE